MDMTTLLSKWYRNNGTNGCAILSSVHLKSHFEKGEVRDKIKVEEKVRNEKVCQFSLPTWTGRVRYSKRIFLAFHSHCRTSWSVNRIPTIIPPPCNLRVIRISQIGKRSWSERCWIITLEFFRYIFFSSFFLKRGIFLRFPWCLFLFLGSFSFD